MKKKATKKKATRKKPERTKGGFGVYLRQESDVPLENGAPMETISPDRIILNEIVYGLKDTQDAIKWVRKNAEEYEGKTLVIAQVKQTITCTVEKTVRVKIQEV